MKLQTHCTTRTSAKKGKRSAVRNHSWGKKKTSCCKKSKQQEVLFLPIPAFSKRQKYKIDL
jgi:hypothetical protein